MSFETWWAQYGISSQEPNCDAERCRRAFNAGAAEMREKMECGHPKACRDIMPDDSDPILGRWQPGCTVCAELAALNAERDKLREALQGIVDIGKRDLTNPKYDGYFQSAKDALLASAAKEE